MSKTLNNKWKAILQLTKKILQNCSVILSAGETKLLKHINMLYMDSFPACNPECADLNARQVPYDFDLRIIDYFSTSQDLSEQERATIHKAIMRYNSSVSQPLKKLSVHVIQEFSKTLTKVDDEFEKQKKTLKEMNKSLKKEIKSRNEYASKLLILIRNRFYNERTLCI